MARRCASTAKRRLAGRPIRVLRTTGRCRRKEAGFTQEAIASERAAIELDASNGLAHNGLGLLHAEAGRHAEARQSFSRAAILDPTNAAYQAHLGHAARELGDLQEAEAAYLRALAIDDRAGDALNGLGVVLVQTRRAPEAVSRLERAVALEPAFVEAQLNLGIARQEVGDRDGARAAYERVLRAPVRFANERREQRLTGGVALIRSFVTANRALVTFRVDLSLKL